MLTLDFGSPVATAGGRRVRSARFDARSLLPVSAACVVANGVRELLSSLLAVPAELRLLEPRLPSPQAWAAIARDAQMVRVTGPLANAALVLRSPDAVALAAAGFGEERRGSQALSGIESEVIARLLRSLTGALSAVCGRELSAPEPILDISGYATYFELLVERPVRARIGVALSREPAAQAACATLRLEDLLDVEVDLRAEFARGFISAPTLLGLGPGSNVPMMTSVGGFGVLKADGMVLARGECGAIGLRSAMILQSVR